MEVKKDVHTPAKHLVVYSLGNFISNMSKENTDGGAMVRMELVKYFDIVQMRSCDYSLIWTSRPFLSGKKNYEVYPAGYISKPIDNKEFIRMDRFLKNARALFDKNNRGIKEHIF